MMCECFVENPILSVSCVMYKNSKKLDQISITDVVITFSEKKKKLPTQMIHNRCTAYSDLCVGCDHLSQYL